MRNDAMSIAPRATCSETRVEPRSDGRMCTVPHAEPLLHHQRTGRSGFRNVMHFSTADQPTPVSASTAPHDAIART